MPIVDTGQPPSTVTDLSNAPSGVRPSTRAQTSTTATTKHAFEHRGGTSWGISRPESGQQCATRPDNEATTNLVTNAIPTSLANERQVPDGTLNQRVVGSSPTRPTIRNPVTDGVLLVSRHCIPKGHLMGGCAFSRGHAIAWVDSQARRSPHAEGPIAVHGRVPRGGSPARLGEREATR